MRLVTIRALDIGDSDRLYRFYRDLPEEVHALFRPFPEITPGVIHTHLDEARHGQHVSLGLLDDDAIVGHGFIMRIPDPNPVFGIGISPDYQGFGNGRRLMSRVIELGEPKARGDITLTVLKRNQKAIRMYRQFGFRIVGSHTFKTPEDSYFMIRNSGQTPEAAP